MQIMKEKLCQLGDSRFLLKPRVGVAVWLCRPASQRGGGARLAVLSSPRLPSSGGGQRCPWSCEERHLLHSLSESKSRYLSL